MSVGKVACSSAHSPIYDRMQLPVPRVNSSTLTVGQSGGDGDSKGWRRDDGRLTCNREDGMGRKVSREMSSSQDGLSPVGALRSS